MYVMEKVSTTGSRQIPFTILISKDGEKVAQYKISLRDGIRVVEYPNGDTGTSSLIFIEGVGFLPRRPLWYFIFQEINR